MNTHPQTFQVQGMTCGHCVRAVTEAVKTVDPKAEVVIDLSSGRVDVQSLCAADAIAEAIRDGGYSVLP